MSAQNQVQVKKAQDLLIEAFRRLDNGGELNRKELRKLIEAIDEVDEAYSGSVDKAEVESSTKFVLEIEKMPREFLWLVGTGDESNYRVGEVLVYDVLLARNFSEKPQTEETILVEDSEVAEAFAKALGLSGDVEYDCVDFWVKNVKTEAFKCFNDNTVMYIVVAPKVVYTVYTAGGKDRFAVVRNEGAVKAFHALLNVPL